MIVGQILGAGITALPAVIAVSIASAILLLATLIKPSIFGAPINRLISFVFNGFLSWRHPIRNTQTGKTIPGAPFQWPDGQGDIAKYILGAKNSDIWQQKYGDIYRVWAGTTPEVVVTRPDQLNIIFKDSDKHIKATNGDSGYFMSMVLGKCMGLMSGGLWKTTKAMAAPPFRHAAAMTNLDEIRRHITELFTQLETTGNLKRGLIHPVQDLKMLPFFIVADFIYGKLNQEMIEDLRRIAPTREDLFKHVVFGGLPRYSISQYLPTAANKQLKTFKQEWRNFNDRAYERSKAKGTDTLVYQMYQAVDEGLIPRERIDQTMDEMLYANLDVTTGALSWNLVFLAANQDALAKLIKEINASTATEEEERAYVAKSDTYLAACILESARLRPVTPFTIPQAPPTDRVVDGYLIPANTNVIVDTWTLNVRSDFWAPDNTSYRPDRFMNAKTSELRYHYWRFGFGPRNCIGRYTADVIIRATLIHLLKNYTLEPIEKADWANNPESWITHPDLFVKCTPLRK